MVRWFCDRCKQEMKDGKVTTIHYGNVCLYNAQLCDDCVRLVVLTAKEVK